MKAGDLFELAGRNLRESVLRNSLTTVGISVGVASLVAMLSLGVGLQQITSTRLQRSGLFDSIYVTSQRADASRGMDPHAQHKRANKPAAPLSDAARAAITKLPGVAEVYPDLRFPAQIRLVDEQPADNSGNGRQSSAKDDQSLTTAVQQGAFQLISAMPTSGRQLEAFDTLKGSFFSSQTAEEIILQADEAKALTDKPDDLIGKYIYLRYAQRRLLEDSEKASSEASQFGAASDLSVYAIEPTQKKLKVVGILESRADAGLRGPSGSNAYVPISFAETLHPMTVSQPRLAGDPLSNSYSALVVRANKSSQIENIENKIKDLGFNTFSLLDATRSLRRFFAILDMFLAIFGSLALTVASLGIINTLVMSILERRREIGIMKAIGASDADVQRLFFAEAGAMGILGGSLGVLIGWLLGRIINFATKMYMMHQEQFIPDDIWLVPWWLVLGAIGFSLVVSLIAGMYPARRAARLDPVQALRYD